MFSVHRGRNLSISNIRKCSPQITDGDPLFGNPKGRPQFPSTAWGFVIGAAELVGQEWDSSRWETPRLATGRNSQETAPQTTLKIPFKRP